MIDNKRRIFLRNSSALAASGALVACGGGSGVEAETDAFGTQLAAGIETGSSGKSTAPPRNTIVSTPIIGAKFTVLSTTGQTTVPFSLGFAFRKGDVVSGRNVVSDIGTLQVTVKNRWPDGSLKFAILSGVVQVPTAAGVVVNLSSTTAAVSSAAAIPTSQLRLTGAVAEFGCGAFGTVRFEGADWDSAFQSWISGPVMSSWIFRKAVGTDKHLVAWLEVRMFANGAIEMLPWIENGFLRVAAPSNKSATFSFMLNRSQRMSAAIDLKHHQRTPLISGTALSYWAAQDPGVIARQDVTYLQLTELVPSYHGQLAAGATALATLVTSYQPLQAGNFDYDNDSMASAGFQNPIGLLPQHDAAYLTSNALVAFGAVVRNGFSAGRYGIHYRDEGTNRPLRFSAYPTLNIGDGQGFKDNGGSSTGQYTPAPVGGNPPQWDVAHSPSVGYLAYLVTGRWYFMEEVQFATTANYLGNGDNAMLRTGSKGLVQSCLGAWQTRSTAWDWRARVQALSVTPDDDTALRAEFVASVEANIEHFHSRYVAQPNNPFGFIKPGGGYDNTKHLEAPWMQDFVTAAFGYSLSLGLPISGTASTKLGAFFAWKARSAIMRLGTKDGFWYINAVPYTIAISPSVTPDYDKGTGPWFNTAAEIYNSTYATKPGWLGATEGVLAAEYMPGDNALWGNLVPAIAYAVQHNVPGAQDAYNRMVGASNWKALADAFNNRPVWGVKPARYVTPPPAVVVPPPVGETETQTGDPTWMAGSALHQWIDIPGTAGAGGSAVFAFSGFAYNEKTNEILIAAAGGHGDSADNRVVSLKLTDNAPSWRQRAASSTVATANVPYYADGKPISRHLYSSLHFVPQVNRLMAFGVTGAYGAAYSFATVDAFNLDTNTWDKAGTWASMVSGNNGEIVLRTTGEVFSTSLARWSPSTNTWSQPIVKRTEDQIRFPIAHDPVRNQLFTLNWGDGQGSGFQRMFATRVPLSGSEQITVTFNPSPAVNSFIADKPTYAGMDYDPHNDRFLFYCGQGEGAGRIYAIKPNAGNVWDMSILQIAGTRPPAVSAAGVHNRFRYIPALRGFLLMATPTSNLLFVRTGK